jgi:hypothetical protein
MASEPPTALPASQPLGRLAGQLQSLSELTESLAYRLLELEERLQPLLAGPAAPDPQMADTELRLDDTEQRLTRLESLLSGLDGSAATRQTAVSLVAEPPAAADPFFEEGEQAFMDEEQEALALDFQAEDTAA